MSPGALMVNTAGGDVVPRETLILRILADAGGFRMSPIFCKTTWTARNVANHIHNHARQGDPLLLFVHASDAPLVKINAEMAGHLWPPNVYLILYSGGEPVGESDNPRIKILRVHFPGGVPVGGYRFGRLVAAAKAVRDGQHNGKRFEDIDINGNAVDEKLVAAWMALDILIQGAMELQKSQQIVPEEWFDEVGDAFSGLPVTYSEIDNKCLAGLDTAAKTQIKEALVEGVGETATPFFQFHAALVDKCIRKLQQRSDNSFLTSAHAEFIHIAGVLCKSS